MTTLPADTLKIVLLSDLHIVPEGEVVETLDTSARLAQGVRAINDRHADADLCIIAGDLADLGETAAYHRLQGLLEPLKVPCKIMIGNHDKRENFLEVFGQERADETGFVQEVIDIKGYRLILLDSVIPGTHAGGLCQTRLDWIKERLLEALDRPVLIFLHHHVVPLWTDVDSIILGQSKELVEILGLHPDVRHVLSGHVHMTTSATWNGIAFSTIGGNHYTVKPHVVGTPGEGGSTEGPAQMGVVLATADHVSVLFDDYIDRNAEIAPENFRRQRPARR